jgi:type II secretory pathway component GspD/PulD (secretin)
MPPNTNILLLSTITVVLIFLFEVIISTALADGTTLDTSALGMVINALNSLGNANILSTPSIVTLDNEEAEIIVGNEVPFITNTQLSSNNSNPFQNYERKNVGLTLKVKPQINEGSGVKLKIEQEVSDVVPSASAVDVITSKRKIKTTEVYFCRLMSSILSLVRIVGLIKISKWRLSFVSVS